MFSLTPTPGVSAELTFPERASGGRAHHSVAHCHLGLGKLYRRTGKPEQAQERRATATTMYREMGMTYWLEKAERAMNDDLG